MFAGFSWGNSANAGRDGGTGQQGLMPTGDGQLHGVQVDAGFAPSYGYGGPPPSYPPSSFNSREQPEQVGLGPPMSVGGASLQGPPNTASSMGDGGDLKEHMKRAHHMTRLMVHSAEESLTSKLEQETQARTEDIAAIKSDTVQIKSRLDKLEAAGGGAGASQQAINVYMEQMRDRMDRLEAVKAGQGTNGIGGGADLAQKQLLQQVNDEMPGMKTQLEQLVMEVDALKKTQQPSSLWSGYSMNPGVTQASLGMSTTMSTLGMAAYSPGQAPGGAAEFNDSQLKAMQAEIASIKADVERRHQEILTQIHSLRVLTEHSAVRAGFLAVAASECAQEEKAWLFNKLKAREDALISMQDNPRTELPALQPPAAAAAELASRAKALAGGPAQDFEIVLERKMNESLGVTINSTNEKVLIVEKVDAGLIMNWNRRNPDKEVIGMDQIISCNGKGGSAEEIMLEISRAQELRLRIRRGGAGAVPGGGVGMRN